MKIEKAVRELVGVVAKRFAAEGREMDRAMEDAVFYQLLGVAERSGISAAEAVAVKTKLLPKTVRVPAIVGYADLAV